MPELAHKKTADMDGYSSDVPYCSLGLVHTCSTVEHVNW